MKLGVCAGPDRSRQLADAGFDFLEVNVQQYLRPEVPAAEWSSIRSELKDSALPITAANSFVPASLRITGEGVDEGRLKKYVSTAADRASELGIRHIVFGSGGARSVPDGFDPEEAWRQIVRFCRMAAEAASAHGVIIVIEPLNRSECNIITSLETGARLAHEVDHEHCKLLVDAYHWQRENDRPESIVECGPILAHAHIATYEKRLAPGSEEADFVPFINALKKCGYAGGLSIEGKWQNPERESPVACRLLRTLIGN